MLSCRGLRPQTPRGSCAPPRPLRGLTPTPAGVFIFGVEYAGPCGPRGWGYAPFCLRQNEPCGLAPLLAKSFYSAYRPSLRSGLLVGAPPLASLAAGVNKRGPCGVGLRPILAAQEPLAAKTFAGSRGLGVIHVGDREKRPKRSTNLAKGSAGFSFWTFFSFYVGVSLSE